MIKKMNRYFFGEDTVALSDMVWFYGYAGVAILFSLILIFVFLI